MKYTTISTFHTYYNKVIQWMLTTFIVWLSAFQTIAQTTTSQPSPIDLMFGFTDHLAENFQPSLYTKEDTLSTSERNKRNAQLLQSLSCESTLYLRQNMTTQRRGFIVRYIPGMFQLEKGRHSYLTEVEMRVQHRQPGTVDCKVTAYHTDSRYQQSNRFVNMGRFGFTIYDAKLFIDELLNPFHRRNKRFYRYSYLFSLPATSTSPATYCLSIKPRFSNEQLVEGIAYINCQTGAVVRFRFQFRHQFSKLSINANMGIEGYDRLVPQRMRITSQFRLLGNHVDEQTDIIAHHNFNVLTTIEKGKERFDYTRFCQLRLDTTRIITSQAYFDSIRPIPLRGFEFQKLQRTSTLETLQPSDFIEEALDTQSLHSYEQWKTMSAKKNTSSDRTQNLLLSSHAFNLTSNGTAQLNLPPIFTPSMAQWSGTRGLSLKTRLSLNINLSSTNIEPTSMLSISPMVAYSFKQKQVYWETPISLKILPHLNGELYFTAGGGAHNYNNEQAEELNRKFSNIEKYDTLIHIINHYGFHDYRDTYANFDFALSPVPGFSFTLGSRYHRRTLIDWNNVAHNAGFIHRLTTLGPSIELKWTPAQYYYKQGKRRIPLFSHYPSFLLKYEHGFALGSGETSYERIESDIQYRLPLYALRTLYFRVGSGLFTRRRKQCFLDYDYFRFNYVPQEWNDELTGEFQLLNARFYNESRYYLRLTSTYESPMLLLSRLSPFSRLIQNERLYLNLLTVRSLPLYAEIGYGISTHLLNLGTFMSIAPDHSCNIGCKVVFRLFED